jgi:hypothetical protein
VSAVSFSTSFCLSNVSGLRNLVDVNRRYRTNAVAVRESELIGHPFYSVRQWAFGQSQNSHLDKGVDGFATSEFGSVPVGYTVVPIPSDYQRTPSKWMTDAICHISVNLRKILGSRPGFLSQGLKLAPFEGKNFPRQGGPHESERGQHFLEGGNRADSFEGHFGSDL